MAHISGKSGFVKYGAGPSEISGMKSWSIDYTVEAMDVTDFEDDGVKAFIAGCSSWSGSFEGFKDGAPISIGSEVALECGESDAANQEWTGQAIITGIHPSTDVENPVGYSYDFQGTGALTPASA